ncbi:MAG: CapA family protein [Flavobacteriaceae bacterium]
MKLIITGDLVINKKYPLENISQEVIDLFQNSDYNIVNLEAPVTESKRKIIKTGPHLKANKKSTTQVLKSLNIDLVTLANNHVLDYDEQGVLDTLQFCKEIKIATVGAEKNKEEASKIFYLDSQEGKIAIINIAENEWASAAENKAGANGMDLIDDIKNIQKAKTQSDYVFVIVHGGHEYYHLPSPRMQKQYRFYVDNGADMVVGHHTHYISGSEEYKGKHIYYSLGNFLFTNSSSFENWYLGLLLEVEIKNGKLTPQLHPIKQEKESFELSLLNAIEKQEVLNHILDYDRIIADSDKLKREWDIYVESKYESYLNLWSPVSFIENHYLKAAFNKLRIRILNKKGIALKLNLLRCEAHANMSKEVIEKYLRK